MSYSTHGHPLASYYPGPPPGGVGAPSWAPKGAKGRTRVRRGSSLAAGHGPDTSDGAAFWGAMTRYPQGLPGNTGG